MIHENLKPDWTNRRLIIKLTLRMLSFFLFLTLVGAAVLAYYSKFTFYVSLFYTVFAACSFVLMLGIIGSYVFGARWENKDFLHALAEIVPDFDGGGPQEALDVGEIDIRPAPELALEPEPELDRPE